MQLGLDLIIRGLFTFALLLEPEACLHIEGDFAIAVATVGLKECQTSFNVHLGKVFFQNGSILLGFGCDTTSTAVA